MNIWIYIRTFVAWTWRALRAWFEVGRRLRQIEEDLQQQETVRKQEVEHLKQAISAAAESDKSEFCQIRNQVEELEKQQREQLTNLDRALQSRVDEWARQLSGQMNQLYAAIASSPTGSRKN